MLGMGIEPMTFGVLCNKVTIVSAYKTNALPTELTQLLNYNSYNTPRRNRTAAYTLEGCHDTISPLGLLLLYFYTLYRVVFLNYFL